MHAFEAFHPLDLQKAGGPAGVKQVQVRSAGTSDWTSLNNLWGGA